MYAIKSIYGTRYLYAIRLGESVSINGVYTTSRILVYKKCKYMSFSTLEGAWGYINKKRQELLNPDNEYKEVYEKQYKGSFIRILSSIDNLCVVDDIGIEGHGTLNEKEKEQIKWCKLRKYGYYR